MQLSEILGGSPYKNFKITLFMEAKQPGKSSAEQIFGFAFADTNLRKMDKPSQNLAFCKPAKFQMMKSSCVIWQGVEGEAPRLETRKENGHCKSQAKSEYPPHILFKCISKCILMCNI